MPLVPFNELPDTARLWVFPGSRPLDPSETGRLLSATDEFLGGWAAHRVPLNAARDWRYDQFLFVAADEARAGASGCSIDALVRSVRELERDLGMTLTNNAPVWFRSPGGTIECVDRGEFQQLAERGNVGPDTVVFDHTIQTVGALREARWEVPASRSWHGEVFFPAHRH